MAHEQGGNPDFDFGPERSYNWGLVAETVLWPLVDELWRGEWREESDAGSSFRYPKFGEHEGRFLAISLEADHHKRFTEEAAEGVHEVSLLIEESLPDRNRSIAMAAIKAAADELYGEPEDEDYDGEDETADEEDLYGWWWPEDEEEHEDIMLVKGAIYSFDTEDDFMITLYRGARWENRLLNVPIADAEDHDGSPDTIRAHDLEAIESALAILKAPRRVAQAMQAVRDHPTEVY